MGKYGLLVKTIKNLVTHIKKRQKTNKSNFTCVKFVKKCVTT